MPSSIDLIIALYEEMLTHHGARIGVRHARKHLGWALDAAAETASISPEHLKSARAHVLTSEEPAEVRRRLAAAYRRVRLEGCRMSHAEQIVSFPPESADTVLNALPHPILMVAPDGKIVEANVAAESFFEVSMLLLRRHALRDLVPFGWPLLALVEQVRNRGSAVNEYRVDLSTPRNPGERLVDLNVAPVPEQPGHVVVMLQERTIADKMDRQLTHRGAARSVIALAVHAGA